MGLLKTRRTKATAQAPTPAVFDNSGAMRATHWPIGVPARQGVQPFEVMSEINSEGVIGRGGGFAEPPDGTRWPPQVNAEFERNVALQPYTMTPAAPSVTKNVGTLPGGPGSTPFFQPLAGNLPANCNYVWRAMGTDREAYILPRLDGNRHVPNAVEVNPAMYGDVGTYITAYTLPTFVGQYPAWNSSSYVVTPAQGTYDQPGRSGIPDMVVVANDAAPPFNPLQSFL